MLGGASWGKAEPCPMKMEEPASEVKRGWGPARKCSAFWAIGEGCKAWRGSGAGRRPGSA